MCVSHEKKSPVTVFIGSSRCILWRHEHLACIANKSNTKLLVQFSGYDPKSQSTLQFTYIFVILSIKISRSVQINNLSKLIHRNQLFLQLHNVVIYISTLQRLHCELQIHVKRQQTLQFSRSSLHGVCAQVPLEHKFSRYGIYYWYLRMEYNS